MSTTFLVREHDDDATKPRRCSFDEAGKLTMCWPLDQAVEGPHGLGTRTQGLKIVSMFSRGEHKFTRNAVRLVSGKFKGNGIEITACPFCASLLSPYMAEDYTVTVTENDTPDLMDGGPVL